MADRLQLFVAPAIDGSVDAIKVGHTHIGLKKGIDDQRLYALIADTGDGQHKLPSKLHQNANGQNPNKRRLVPVAAAQVINAEYRVADKKHQRHHAMVGGGAAPDGNLCKTVAEVLAQQGGA